MIATIVLGIAILITISIAIYSIKKMDCEALFIPVLMAGFFIGIIAGSLYNGYSPEIMDNWEYRKADLIRNYNECPCEYHLDNIQKYNRNIETGNNLWCRFKIDDRSYAIIDIDGLLKEGNQ